MILIVSENIPLTIASYRKQVRGLNRCRLRGTMDGEPTRVVSRMIFPMVVQAVCLNRVIWDGFQPTEEEEELAASRFL